MMEFGPSKNLGLRSPFKNSQAVNQLLTANFLKSLNPCSSSCRHLFLEENRWHNFPKMKQKRSKMNPK